MNTVARFKQSWLYIADRLRMWRFIASWLLVLLVCYGWQILRLGGIRTNLPHILIDLACIFPSILLLAIAFWGQFVLPVCTSEDRLKIVHRLLTYFLGRHGPALLVQNGMIIENDGERLRKGPGVVWLDSASAAVTRTSTKIMQTIGPGIHFLERGEFLAGTVDLHIQTHTIGPKSFEKPFEEQREDQSNEEYDQIQYRRNIVNALTRDGIEVVPNISVAFRVDTGFPKADEPGSRFGYRIGRTKNEKAKEKADQEAIQKAILGENANPMAVLDSPRSRTAWNELPVQVAVDVWREYAAKFTFDEFFQPDQLAPPPSVPGRTEGDVGLFSQPLQVDTSQRLVENNLTVMLRSLNKLMEKMIKWLDGTQKQEYNRATPKDLNLLQQSMSEPQKKTAIQLINEFVKARLTQPEVDELDDHGVRSNRKVPSAEFELLRSHGLKVLNIGVTNFRFHPSIEETIINRWLGSWLNNVMDEKTQIKTRRNIMKVAGEEKAIRQYAEQLSAGLLGKKPNGARDTLRELIMQTYRIILDNEQLHERLAGEQEVFEQMIRWVDENRK